MAQLTAEQLEQISELYASYMESKTYVPENYGFNKFESAVLEAIAISFTRTRNRFVYVRLLPDLDGYFVSVFNQGDAVAVFYKGKDRTVMLQNRKLAVDKQSKEGYNTITR